MNRTSVKLAHAIAIAGVICALAASPALADHDHDWHHEHHHRRRPPVRYYHGYEHRYYAPQPEVYYYPPPPVYAPPPPTWGLNLVFPLRIH